MRKESDNHLNGLLYEYFGTSGYLRYVSLLF
jgi:hypothetical protein